MTEPNSTDKEIIVSVKQENGGLKGTVITDKQTIRYCFDGSSPCCNEYDIVESVPLADLIGQELLDMDLFETDDEFPHNEHKNCCGGQGMFVIRCSTDTYKLQMFNYHNGCYSMNFDVFVDDQVKWNLAF